MCIGPSGVEPTLQVNTLISVPIKEIMLNLGETGQ
jgi:hypothetical protein